MANLALHKKVLEGSVVKSKLVTDGIVTGYTGHDGFSYFEYPGTLTVDLEKAYKLECIQVLLWDGLGTGGTVPNNRKYSYRLGLSIDNADYRDFYNDETVRTIGWQIFHFPQGVKARYVRIYGINNTRNKHIHVVEIEAHDKIPPKPSGHIGNLFQIDEISSIDSERVVVPIKAKERKSIDSEKLSEIISTLESSQALNPNLVNEIRERFQDLIVIDQNLGSIRQEIVNPVTKEIKKANRFAIVALAFTILGLIITIGFSDFGVYLWRLIASIFSK